MSVSDLGAKAAALAFGGEAVLGRRAYVHEIFVSAQGEGVLVGERQIFVRLAGCNIRCPWCDTPEALVARDSPQARIEVAPGSGRFRMRANPLGPGDVLSEVGELARAHGPVRWVALTGGEPLVWGAFLGELLPAVEAAGLRVFLETNSHYPEALRPLLPFVDFVSADIKVPFADYSLSADDYVRFLSLVPRGDLQAKVVVTDGCPDEDVLEAARIVARVDRACPLVLQPVTPDFPRRAPEREAQDPLRPNGPPGAAIARPGAARLLDLQRRCLEIVERVRIIPQTHKLYGAL